MITARKVVVLLTVLGVLAACSSPAPPGRGAALLQERCASCHGSDRVTAVQKSRFGWSRTVDRMIDHGAELNSEERGILIDYLAETFGP